MSTHSSAINITANYLSVALILELFATIEGIDLTFL